MQRVNNWCFTLNNPSEEEITFLMDSENATWKYITWGEEVGECGTLHLQGYVEFKTAVTLGMVKKRLGTSRVHLEPRRGTQQQAIEYCHKDGKVFEWGEKSRAYGTGGPDVKNKALKYMDMIREGRMAEIAADPDCTGVLFRHCRDIAMLVEKPRDVNIPPEVRWYYGPTGTGKTRRAWYEAHNLGKGNVYVKSTSSKWFDGYDGERVVIFDDLRSSWFEYSYLLKLLDRYPTQVECKGGSRQWKAEVIYITSPFAPRQMYENMQQRDVDSIEQLVRRVHVVQHMPMTPFGSWTEPVTEEDGGLASSSQTLLDAC